jgi:hypothetical protein
MTILFKGTGQPQHPVTPDGRYFVVRGKLCRMADPDLPLAKKSILVDELAKARSAVRSARLACDQVKEAAAHCAVDIVTREPGERGAVDGRSARLQQAQGDEHPLCKMVFRLEGCTTARGRSVKANGPFSPLFTRRSDQIRPRAAEAGLPAAFATTCQP